jgi:hypothetical protein
LALREGSKARWLGGFIGEAAFRAPADPRGIGSAMGKRMSVRDVASHSSEHTLKKRRERISRRLPFQYSMALRRGKQSR